MAISIKDFWRLLAESRLYSAAECDKLRGRFAELKGEGNSAACAQWLVANRALTRYQAKVLLGGHAGPFLYGPYQLRDRLTSGRLRGCFRAVHVPTRHKVLLWFLSGPVLHDTQAFATALHQISAACQAVHPCLSQTHQFVDLGNYKFVVLEDLAGTAAAETLATRGRLPLAEACRLMRQVALGASALHAVGATHGDISPENVWIDSQGNGRLLQLPLSREPQLPPSSPIDPALAADRAAMLADYAAPELGVAGSTPDALTDVYAIGCTLYHLLTGSPPFAGGDVATKLQRHAAEAIQQPSSRDVSADLFKVIAYAMAKDRRLRYPSASQLAEALAHFVDPKLRNAIPERAPTYAAFEAWLSTQPTPSATAAPAPHANPPMRATVNVPASNAPTARAVESANPVAVVANLPSRQMEMAVPAAPVQSIAIEEPPYVQPALAPDHISTKDFGAPRVADGFGLFATAAQATSAAALIRQRRRRSRNNALFGLALLAAVGIGVGIGYVVYQRGRSQDVAREGKGESAGNGSNVDDGSDDTPMGGQEGSTDNGKSATPTDNIIPDDGKTLWASPTAGEAISWSFLPARAEILLALRPGEVVRNAEGEKLLAALGPYGASARSALEEAVGMPLAEVEQLLVAWTNSEGFWTPTYIVRPATTVSRETLEARWQAFESRQQGAEKFFVTSGRAFAAPAAEEGKIFIVSSVEQMPELLTAGRSASPLVREMVKLLQTSDRDRLCSLLFTKKALLIDAEPRLELAGLGRLHAALAWWLGDDCQAAGISLHLDENCFIEARLVGRAQTTTASELTTAMKDRMKRLAPDIEQFLSQIDLHPHGRRILIGLASMSRFVQQQLRIDSENEQVIINCYLPAVAAHNLILAAELAIVQPVAQTAPPLPKVTSTGADQPGTVAEKLKRTISFLQSGDTLEKALQTVSGEIGVPIEILGGDLAPEGITRNNRFDVNAKDQPASEVIRAILLAANRDGKLVYVIKPKPPGGEETIFVTTRGAAKNRDDTIPPEFAAPADAKTPKNPATPKRK